MSDDDDGRDDLISADQLNQEELRALYMAERSRRETIRSQLAVPGSVVSFSIFGYIYFARELDVGLLPQPLTAVMAALWLASVLALMTAVAYLVRVEITFLRHGPRQTERTAAYVSEYDFFQRAFEATRDRNDRATTMRARGLLMMLLALALFVIAVTLLPFHLASPEWQEPSKRDQVAATTEPR
ncbi:hypothetical protein [Caenispirillum salinarum]|uniref:hypothetical protein n=1 Tax=Caenispirillum salinarum TaxID=859058 RepID=UPI00384EC1BE